MTSPTLPQIPSAPSDVSIVSCTICLCPLEEERDIESQEELITALACQHLFHKNCLAEWISKGRGGFDSCPQCRNPIDEAILSQYPRVRHRVHQEEETVAESTGFSLHGMEAAIIMMGTLLVSSGYTWDSSKNPETPPPEQNNSDRDSVQMYIIIGYIALSTLNGLSYCLCSNTNRRNPEFFPPLIRITVNIYATSQKGYRAIKNLFNRRINPLSGDQISTPTPNLIGRTTEL